LPAEAGLRDAAPAARGADRRGPGGAVWPTTPPTQ